MCPLLSLIFQLVTSSEIMARSIFPLLLLLLSAASLAFSDFACPSSSGFFANPEDCASFYQCSNSVAYLYPCADGTSYDEQMVACNWSDMVDCGARPSDSSDDSDGDDDYDNNAVDGGDDGDDDGHVDGDGDDSDEDGGGDDAEDPGRALPERSMAIYLALTADSMENYTTTKDWTPILHPYQQTSANVLMFTFINPETMQVPKAFENLAATKGSDGFGSVPSDTVVLFSIGG